MGTGADETAEREDFFRLKKVKDGKKILEEEAKNARARWAALKGEKEDSTSDKVQSTNMLSGGDGDVDDSLLIF